MAGSADAVTYQGTALTGWQPTDPLPALGNTLPYIYRGSHSSIAAAEAAGNFPYDYVHEAGTTTRRSWDPSSGNFLAGFPALNSGTWHAYERVFISGSGTLYLLHNEELGLTIQGVNGHANGTTFAVSPFGMYNGNTPPTAASITASAVVAAGGASFANPGVAVGQTIQVGFVNALGWEAVQSVYFDLAGTLARYDGGQDSVFLDGAFRGTNFDYNGETYSFDAQALTLTVETTVIPDPPAIPAPGALLLLIVGVVGLRPLTSPIAFEDRVGA